MSEAIFPHQVEFETTMACPARCLFCPHKDIKVPLGRMSDKLLWKIVKESCEHSATLYPLLNGEPFADKRIWDILDYVQEQRAIGECHPTVVLFSNLAPLNSESIERLLAYNPGTVCRLEMSFEGGNKDSYETTMGLNFEDNKAKALQLFERNKKLGNPISDLVVCMVDCETTHDSIKEFGELFAGYPWRIGTQHNWGGRIEIPNKVLKEVYPEDCSMIKDHVYIRYDGVVCLCCIDIGNEVVLGNVTNESIAEVWSKSEAIRKPIYDLCNKCDFRR